MSSAADGIQPITQAEHDVAASAKRVLDLGFNAGSGSPERQPVLPAGFITTNYDYVAPSFGATTDTYVFKYGGSGGTTVATVTITYTNSTKGTIQSIAKS